MSLAPIQVSPPGRFNGSLTATATLTGVTAGNTILVAVMHGDRGGLSPTIAVSDGQGTYTIDVLASAGLGIGRTLIARLPNAVAGTHTINAVASGGGTAAQSVGGIVAFEEPPVVLDQGSVAGGFGTAVSVAPTAGLVAAGELAIAALYYDALTTGGGTFPPTGGTGAYTNSGVTHTDQSDADYQLLSSTAGAGADWGTFTTAAKYTAAVGIYKVGNTPIAATAAAATSATGDLGKFNASAAAATAAAAALTTAIKAAGAVLMSTAAVGALTNYSTVTLSGTLYTGTGGVLDPNFWLDVTPTIGSVLFYDSTYITIYSNGEISSTTNNCSAVVQFFDGLAWSYGLIVITPQMVSYAHVISAAVGALGTAFQMATAALVASQATGSLTTAVKLAGIALGIANAAAAMTTGVQLGSQAVAAVAVSGALSGGVASLQGAAVVATQEIGAITTRIQTSGQVLADSQATGALSARIIFQGVANSLTQASSQLATGIQFAGNVQVATTAAGAALIQSTFAAAANAVSSALGSLRTGLLIAGDALVSVQVTGALVTAIPLEGAAIVDTAAALQPVGLEGRYGYSIITVLSTTGLPVARATFIQNSACIVSISFVNALGLPFVPTSVQYRVDDTFSDLPLVDWTPIANVSTSNAITVTSAQNGLISLSRTFEQHQILFQITDQQGNINLDSAMFDIIRSSGAH